MLKIGRYWELTLLMAQWVDLEAGNHALSACRCVTILFEAASIIIALFKSNILEIDCEKMLTPRYPLIVRSSQVVSCATSYNTGSPFLVPSPLRLNFPTTVVYPRGLIEI